MHFVKTTLSLFVLASLTSGQSVDPHDAVAVRSTEEYRNYIAARDEFVEALGLYRRKFGGRKCLEFSGKYKCYFNAASAVCGCSKDKFNKPCSC
ncbi:unnamed protein product [Clonostachys rosea f. rosea IK726]|uniref:Uncharacterized protein n=1 Tax=Clonostachys rosea f. rosea IK726 TaxID=1349383 RepID=A0ACA9U3V3_BIOOC|nr:unnamed protein product [Clonostachys rosea f. rosea IK726]